MNISWLNANPLDHTGYGHVGKELRIGVAKRGVSLLPSTAFGWDAMVICAPPNALYLGPELRPDVIYHTMFEANPVPPGWVDVLNRVGLVWVPSYDSLALFEFAGVTTPIVVGGYGVDPTLFPAISRKGRSGPLRVLAWGDHLISRKNLLKTIQVFLEAELEDATLEVKVNDNLFANGVWATGDQGVHTNVRIITETMRRDELVDWLHSGDVLIYLSGGEGFGLIPLEAMATGLPVICAFHTGMREYLTKETALLVPSRGRMPAPTLTAGYGVPMTIEQPDWDIARDLLRWCYVNREEAAAIGERAAAHAATFTWNRACDRAAEIVTQFVEANKRLPKQTAVL